MRWIQGWGIVVREVLAGGEEDGAAGWQLRQVGTEPPLMGRVCSACQPTQAGAPPCRRLLRVWKMPIQGSIHLSDVGPPVVSDGQACIHYTAPRLPHIWLPPPSLPHHIFEHK